MTKLAAFRGSYADWRLIKTRGCVQVVFEIPLAESDAAYQALGGMPNSASERWFGIARLNDGVDTPSEAAGERVAPDNTPAASPKLNGSCIPGEAAGRSRQDRGEADQPYKPRKPVAADKKLAQQAGILCSEPAFQRFLTETGLAPDMTEHDAADCVRDFCGVISRAEIAPGSKAAELWIDLRGKYEAWKIAA